MSAKPKASTAVFMKRRLASAISPGRRLARHHSICCQMSLTAACWPSAECCFWVSADCWPSGRERNHHDADATKISDNFQLFSIFVLVLLLVLEKSLKNRGRGREGG